MDGTLHASSADGLGIGDITNVDTGDDAQFDATYNVSPNQTITLVP